MTQEFPPGQTAAISPFPCYYPPLDQAPFPLYHYTLKAIKVVPLKMKEIPSCTLAYSTLHYIYEIQKHRTAKKAVRYFRQIIINLL